mmetsp:Transcript_50314/g.60679  ORF Transcript_50314/g.60679 Transcript_50314/m.60679 type:complete len:200 (-) Transcript_50314:282-881(-)
MAARRRRRVDGCFANFNTGPVSGVFSDTAWYFLLPSSSSSLATVRGYCDARTSGGTPSSSSGENKSFVSSLLTAAVNSLHNSSTRCNFRDSSSRCAGGNPHPLRRHSLKTYAAKRASSSSSSRGATTTRRRMSERSAFENVASNKFLSSSLARADAARTSGSECVMEGRVIGAEAVAAAERARLKGWKVLFHWGSVTCF